MEKAPINGFRMSPQQDRLWTLAADARSLAYQVNCEALVEGELDTENFRRAAEEVIARHEILRTTFRKLTGMNIPVQVVGDICAPAIAQHDLRGLNAEEQIARLASLYDELVQSPFDIERGPLVRFSLATLSDAKRVLFVSLSALCADRASCKNLIAEIFQCYDTASDSESDEAIQYAELAQWQNDLLESSETEAGKEFWKEQDASDFFGLKLPFENKAAEAESFKTAYSTFDFTTDAAGKIEVQARRYNTSMATFLLACWQTLLRRLTGQSSIVVGTLYDGRKYEELEQSQGLFARCLPVRCPLGDQLSFADALKEADTVVAQVYNWQEYFTFDDYQPEQTSDNSQPFFAFSFEFDDTLPELSAAGVCFSISKLQAHIDRFKVKLSCARKGDDLVAEFHYDTTLFHHDDIERLASQFLKLVESAVKNPESLIAHLDILGDAERSRLLIEFNDTKADYLSSKRIHDLFEHHAQMAPNRPAIAFEDRRLTYGELNARANQLARHICGLDVGIETRVAIFAERSIEMIECMLAILKAGCVYLPMDLAYPKERLAYMLEDAGVEVVLTQKHLVERLPVSQAKVVCIDSDWPLIEQSSGENLQVSATAENLAYVIYTSGSTGKPKGVSIEHRQIVNYANAIIERLDLSSSARFATVSTLAADLGYTVVFPALCAGGELHVLSSERISDANSMADYFSRNQIDCLKIVPSYLEALLSSPRADQIIPKKRLVLGGEASVWELTERIKSIAPDCEIYNHYGPTESTVGVLTYKVNGEPSQANSADHSLTVPLGKPLSNAQVYLLDSHLQPVPTGVAGEAHISGAGLARGYLNKPELTAERFLPNPFSQEPGARMYKTGDLARFLRDGNAEFLGRVDDQVKVRGFRIELGEIETALREHPGAQDALVLPKTDASGNKKLVAYVVPNRKYAPTINGKTRYRLPNGLAIVHQNRNETDYTYHEIFEEQSYFRHGISIGKDACVFDVGANIGLFTLFVSQRFPSARILSFEPIGSIFNLLDINAELYGSNVKAMRIGLSDSERVEEFTYYPGYSVMSGMSAYTDATEEMATVKQILQNRQEGGADDVSDLIEHADELLADHFEAEISQCRLRTISNVIADENIEQIDLLKIDVQRAELDVLKGIRDEDWPKIKQIVMEAHDGQGQKTEGRLGQIIGMLEQHGFSVTAEQDELFKGTDRHTLYAVRGGAAAQSESDTFAASLNQAAVAEIAAPFSESDLADYLKAKLPDYMVPSVFITLESFPLNPNGKIDRAALPSPDESNADSQNGYAAPGTSVEKTLAEIWSKVLGVERVGLHDSFFKLGGDSIMSIQVIVRAGQAGIHLTPRQLFQHPTIAQLAAVANTAATAQAEQGLIVGKVPLTPIQHWFFEDDPIDPHHWNMALMLEAREKIDPVLLEKALQSLLSHHDALRLRIERASAGWEQSISGLTQDTILSSIDLTSVSHDRRITELEIAAALVQQGISLRDGQLMRVALFDLGESEPERLLIVIHHMGVDGVSWRILLDDLQTVYDQLRTNQSPQLPPKTTSYLRWSTGLAEHAQSPELLREIDYWTDGSREKIIPLPVDFEYGNNTAGSTSTVSVSLTAEETRSLLQEAPEAYNTQINDLLLTALAQAFREWTGTHVLLVDLEGHGREEILSDADISRTIGCFTTRFPAQIDLGDSANIGEEIKRVKEMLRSIPNHGIGYGLLRYLSEDANAQESLRRLPQPEISFNYLGQFDQALPGFASFAPARESAGPPRSLKAQRRHLLEINGQVSGGRLQMVWRYSEAIHQRDSIARLAQLFIEALQSVINHCLSPEAGGYSPSDFAEFGWNQEDLDDIVSQINGSAL